MKRRVRGQGDYIDFQCTLGRSDLITTLMTFEVHVEIVDEWNKKKENLSKSLHINYMIFKMDKFHMSTIQNCTFVSTLVMMLVLLLSS